MKLSLNWLKEYVDPKLSADELSNRLTMAGLEVEAVHHVGTDTVYDIEITPNRPDCLNMQGLAREVAAICAKNIKNQAIKILKPSAKPTISVEIKDIKDCMAYSASVLCNAQIKSSTGKIASLLESLGIRAINNAVDVTNFCLMDMGQPMHVFDLDKIEGGKIIVRRANAGETIVTLDGQNRKLDPSILIIADAKKPIAIAGIMGGLDSSVDSSTKNILLECAHFDMGLIRQASRKLGLKSDSSYRFERGVDVFNLQKCASRAVELLIEQTGAKPLSHSSVGKKLSAKPHVILITHADIEGLLGTKVSLPKIKNALTRLGLLVRMKKAGQLHISVPTFRGDLKQSVDIIEEVARVIGYDHLDVSFPNIQVHNIPTNPRTRQLKKKIHETLRAQGFSECITYALIGKKDLEKTGLGDNKAIFVHNALSSEHNLMRPSLLPSLLGVAMTNVHRSEKNIQIFELAKRYGPARQGKHEFTTLGILSTGRLRQDWRDTSKRAGDFYDIKGALESIFKQMGISVDFASATAKKPFDDKCFCAIIVDGKQIGSVGRISADVLAQWDIKVKEVYAAEVYLEDVLMQPKAQHMFEPLPEFPGISRDISVAVDVGVSFKQVKEICFNCRIDTLKSVELIEEYRGEKIAPGKKGLVFSIFYQSKTQTLREEEVNKSHQALLQALSSQCQASQR